MNLTKTIKIAALCTLPLILTACGGDDSSSNTEAWFKSAPTELEGTWKSGCELEDGDYTITKETYTGNKITILILSYGDDSSCQSENSKTIVTDQLKIGETVGTEYTKVDAIIKHTKTSLSTQESVNVANYYNFLGLNNWKVNVFQDLTNNKESQKEIAKHPMKSIIKIDGNKLYFGDETQGIVNGRPTIIDYNTPAIKQ